MWKNAFRKTRKAIKFLREIDRLKAVVRQSLRLDKSRKENSAEHSWHLAMYALVLHQYANATVNTNRVVQMLLLHDVVEIDVGDFPIHAGFSRTLQAEEEARAAQRLFGLLPQEQRNELLALLEQVLSRYGAVIQEGARLLSTVCEQWVTEHFTREVPKESKQAN